MWSDTKRQKLEESHSTVSDDLGLFNRFSLLMFNFLNFNLMFGFYFLFGISSTEADKIILSFSNDFNCLFFMFVILSLILVMR
jgi:hypothetical protein